jgi:hypothetical protein
MTAKNTSDAAHALVKRLSFRGFAWVPRDGDAPSETDLSYVGDALVFVEQAAKNAGVSSTQFDHWCDVITVVLDQLRSDDGSDWGNMTEACERVADQRKYALFGEDLLEWLGQSVDNVLLVADVMRDMSGSDDVMQAMTAAELRQREQWAHAFVTSVFAFGSGKGT